MGTQTIPNRLPGENIDAAHPNLISDTFRIGLVPRNVTGIPTDLAGSLGSSALRWLAAHLNSLSVYAGSIYTALVRASGGSDYTLNLPNSLPSARTLYPLVGTSGSVEFSGFSQTKSDEIVIVNDLDGVADTVESVTLTTHGRPVLIGLTSRDPATATQNVSSNRIDGGNDYSVSLLWHRDGSLIGSSTLSATNLAGVNSAIFGTIAPFWHIDDGASAGEHTYELKVQGLGGSVSAAVRFCRMFALEL